MTIPDDHFRNVPVGALSPSIEMQQKQQQNLLQRTISFPNNSPPQTNSNSKQQKSSSFWNHFGIGSKQEDSSSNNIANDSSIACPPSTDMNHESGLCRNTESSGLNDVNSGMAPR